MSRGVCRRRGLLDSYGVQGGGFVEFSQSADFEPDAISADGSVVVGYGDRFRSGAQRWDGANGVQLLEDVLTGAQSGSEGRATLSGYRRLSGRQHDRRQLSVRQHVDRAHPASLRRPTNPRNRAVRRREYRGWRRMQRDLPERAGACRPLRIAAAGVERVRPRLRVGAARAVGTTRETGWRSRTSSRSRE